MFTSLVHPWPQFPNFSLPTWTNCVTLYVLSPSYAFSFVVLSWYIIFLKLCHFLFSWEDASLPWTVGVVSTPHLGLLPSPPLIIEWSPGCNRKGSALMPPTHMPNIPPFTSVQGAYHLHVRGGFEIWLVYRSPYLLNILLELVFLFYDVS